MCSKGMMNTFNAHIEGLMNYFVTLTTIVSIYLNDNDALKVSGTEIVETLKDDVDC